MFQGRRDISIIWETGHSILWEKGHFILWEMGNSILWQRFYPLGIGPLILWDSGHPLGNGTWGTGHALPWESDHLFSGKNPLGIGNLGDGFQPLYSVTQSYANSF